MTYNDTYQMLAIQGSALRSGDLVLDGPNGISGGVAQPRCVNCGNEEDECEENCHPQVEIRVVQMDLWGDLDHHDVLPSGWYRVMRVVTPDPHEERMRRCADQLLDAFIEQNGHLPDENAEGDRHTSNETFLVAFGLDASDDNLLTRHHWELRLHDILKPLTGKHKYGNEFEVCWWVAEDDRQDRSDNDSAVFCGYGKGNQARALIIQHGLD